MQTSGSIKPYSTTGFRKFNRCLYRDQDSKAALARAVARYKLTPAEQGASTGTASKTNPATPIPLLPLESVRRIQAPQQSESFREARTALQHHLDPQASSDTESTSDSPTSDYEGSDSTTATSSSPSHRRLRLSPSELHRKEQRQKLDDRHRRYKLKQLSFSHLRPPAVHTDWDSTSQSSFSDESRHIQPPDTPLPLPVVISTPASNGRPNPDHSDSPVSASTLLSYRSVAESAQPRVVVNITVVNDYIPAGSIPARQLLDQNAVVASGHTPASPARKDKSPAASGTHQIDTIRHVPLLPATPRELFPQGKQVASPAARPEQVQDASVTAAALQPAAQEVVELAKTAESSPSDSIPKAHAAQDSPQKQPAPALPQPLSPPPVQYFSTVKPSMPPPPPPPPPSVLSGTTCFYYMSHASLAP